MIARLSYFATSFQSMFHITSHTTLSELGIKHMQYDDD